MCEGGLRVRTGERVRERVRGRENSEKEEAERVRGVRETEPSREAGGSE